MIFIIFYVFLENQVFGLPGSWLTRVWIVVGTALALEDATKVEMSHRVACAWRKFWSLKQLPDSGIAMVDLILIFGFFQFSLVFIGNVGFVASPLLFFS